MHEFLALNALYRLTLFERALRSRLARVAILKPTGHTEHG
jgi:hypothetical protein